ncbi:hypothetical protein DMH17_00870 [Raoultella planticola]|nr:hypothetical protein [Raoultella planticola]
MAIIMFYVNREARMGDRLIIIHPAPKEQ